MNKLIAPHEGQELEFMLAGKKFLASFGDVIPENGKIAERIIPERKFAPYVKKGTFLRKEKRYHDGERNLDILYVSFVVPGYEWRAETLFWLREMVFTKMLPVDATMETLIGRLLDYSNEAIDYFVSKTCK